MQHIAGERRSEVFDGEGTEHIETPDLEDDTVPAFHNNEQSDGGHNHIPEHDADASLSTFANSHSRAPSISTQSSHKCTASTSRPPQSMKRGCLEAFKVETDTRESRMVELASK